MKFGVVVWILLGLLGLLIGTKKGRKGILFLSSILCISQGLFMAFPDVKKSSEKAQ